MIEVRCPPLEDRTKFSLGMFSHARADGRVPNKREVLVTHVLVHGHVSKPSAPSLGLVLSVDLNKVIIMPSICSIYTQHHMIRTFALQTRE